MKPVNAFSGQRFGRITKAPPSTPEGSESTPSSSSTAPRPVRSEPVTGGVWGDPLDPYVWEQMVELSTKPFSFFEEEAKRRVLEDNKLGHKSTPHAKSDPRPLWMRRQRDRLQLAYDLMTNNEELDFQEDLARGLTSSFYNLERYGFSVGQTINAKFAEEHTYMHNGRPVQVIYLTYEGAPAIERECYLSSILSPMRVVCFYLRAKKKDPPQEQEIVLKDGMKDVVFPYMCLPCHQPDTLFIVHEGDFRLTAQSCEVTCLDEPPDKLTLSEEELKVLESTTATTYSRSTMYKADAMSPEGKTYLDACVSLATCAHEAGRGDVIWCGWNSCTDHHKRKKGVRATDIYNGSQQVMYSCDGAKKCYLKLHTGHSPLRSDYHYDLILKKELLLADMDNEDDVHVCYCYPLFGG